MKKGTFRKMFSQWKRVCRQGFSLHSIFGKKGPTPLEIGVYDKCLCVAFSPGDETIGMGGTLAKYPENFTVACCIGNEWGGREGDCSSALKARLWGFKNALHVAGIERFQFLDVRGRGGLDACAAFSQLEIAPYDFIFIPDPFERFPDRMAMSFLLVRLIGSQRHKSGLRIFWYSTKSSSLGNANRYSDIKEYIFTIKRMSVSYGKAGLYRSRPVNNSDVLTREGRSGEDFRVISVRKFCAKVKAIAVGRSFA